MGEERMAQPGDIRHIIRRVEQDISELRRDLYGSEKISEKGVFARLDKLEHDARELRAQYEREKVEMTAFEALENRLDALDLNYRIVIVYLRGIAGAVGTIVVAVLVAAVVGVLRVVAGGG